ncbi:MAG: class I SAM-dependent methyltransferase [Thermoleophilia bacterium]
MTERIASRTVPLPPPALAARVGTPDPSDPLAGYDDLGRQLRQYILDVLPADWSFEGKRILDFGCGAGRVLRAFLPEAQVAEFYGCDIDEQSIEWLDRHLSPPLHVLRSHESPPLELPGDSFDLVYATSVFTHLADEWSAWLLELHRLLKDGGYLLATFLGSGMSQRIAEEPWVEGRVGMNVLRHGQSWNLGGPMILHSPWWIREHWGRAFEIAELREAGVVTEAPGDGHGVVLMRKRAGTFTREELERIDAVTEPRELAALRHNIRQLHRESDELEARAASIDRAYQALEESRAVRFVRRLRNAQSRLGRPR